MTAPSTISGPKVAAVPESAPGPKTAPPRSTAAAFALLGAIQISLIFTYASLAVPLPRIGREFGLVHADLILLSAAYGLSFAGLLLFGGRLADRYGGRAVLTAGLLVFGAASALAPLSPTYGALLGARFGQGVGAALVAPAAMTVLRTVFPQPVAYARAMATWGGLSMIGATAGNLLAGALSALTSWRVPFLIPLAVAALGIALGPRVLPANGNACRSEIGNANGARTERRSLDLPGALLSTAGITLASYGLVVTDVHGWISYGVLVPLLAGLALTAGFLVLERRSPDPLLPPRFLLDGRRALGLAAVGVTAAGTATIFVLVSLHLQQGRGWSALATSAAFVPFAAVLLTAGRLAGPLIARFGAGAVTAGGLGVGAAGLVVLALVGFDPRIPYAVGMLPGLLLLPVGAAASFAGAAILATDRVPAHQAGLAGGLLNTAMELGPTVLLAAALSLGGVTGPVLALGTAFTALAFVNSRLTHTR